MARKGSVNLGWIGSQTVAGVHFLVSSLWILTVVISERVPMSVTGEGAFLPIFNRYLSQMGALQIDPKQIDHVLSLIDYAYVISFVMFVGLLLLGMLLIILGPGFMNEHARLERFFADRPTSVRKRYPAMTLLLSMVPAGLLIFGSKIAHGGNPIANDLILASDLWALRYVFLFSLILMLLLHSATSIKVARSTKN
jgi:hypothetical protein